MTKEPNNEPIKLESEDIFDSEFADRAVANPEFLPGVDDPMLAQYSKFLSEMKEMFRPAMIAGPIALQRPAMEYSVRIFVFNKRMRPQEICTEIDTMLNGGWRIDNEPMYVGHYVMFIFSRVKEEPKNNG